MAKVFIDRVFIDKSEWPNQTDDAFEVEIPDNCATCNNIISIYNVGNKDWGGALKSPVCDHFQTWPQVWKSRIKLGGVTITSQSPGGNNINYPVIRVVGLNSMKHSDPTKDGMKCSGSCNSWHPMVEANRGDGTFVCYGCRTGC